MNSKWQKRFMALAAHIGGWSKDPSTKVGAVCVRPDNTIASVGFNGFARGVKDTPERLNDRALKYPLTVHAEHNACLCTAENLSGYSMFVHPLFPCAPCASVLAQKGIKTVYFMREGLENERWAESNKLAIQVLEEVGIVAIPVNMKDGD